MKMVKEHSFGYKLKNNVAVFQLMQFYVSQIADQKQTKMTFIFNDYEI